MDDESDVTLDFFAGRLDRLRGAIDTAVEEAGAYGSDQLVADLEWTDYAREHVTTADRDGTLVVTDPAALSRLTELLSRYRIT